MANHLKNRADKTISAANMIKGTINFLFFPTLFNANIGLFITIKKATTAIYTYQKIGLNINFEMNAMGDCQ